MSGLNSDLRHIPKTIKLFIGGEFPRTESGRSIAMASSDGKGTYAHLCRASRKDLRNAVTAAANALPGWESRSAYNRAQILYRMAEMADARRSEFVEVLVATTKLTAQQAEAEVASGIDSLVYYAGFADKYQQLISTVNPVSGPHHSFSSAEPVGVVGVMATAEVGFGRFVAELSAILASGNTVVALLPEPIAALLAPLAEALATSDLPKGVVNLLSGHLSELGTHFATHMEIQSVSLIECTESNSGLGTEASELRTELRAHAAQNMKRVVEASSAARSLPSLLRFVEIKTVWHPIGN